MKVLILGGDGMLGHQLFARLRQGHEVKVTVRGELSAYEQFGLFDGAHTFAGVDARQPQAVQRTLEGFRPAAVVNCIGVVKQRTAGQDPETALEINALFPHRLARFCAAVGARLVHVSTDCVFSGERGHYRESDPPDARDVYGLTKLLGEPAAPHCVTLRTSMIGLELHRRTSLVEWFLAASGPIKGYARAIFTGFTTASLSAIIEEVLTRFDRLEGVYHVAATPISKYDLLTDLARRIGRTDVSIQRDDAFHCDRSLDGARFAAATGFAAPSWDEMLAGLAAEIRARKG
jgi:dTDP-4-dehydrorhamnose reductase